MGNRIRIGGSSERVKVTLHIFGDDLDPDDITRQLGCPPTKAFRKGDTESKPNDRYLRVAKTGKWFLSMESADELEAVVDTLLEKLTPDRDVWLSLVSKYKLDVYCGVFFGEENNGNGGFSLSPRLMLALCGRGLEIGFDIYYA